MDVGEAGPLVVSAGPEGCSSSSRLGSNDPRLVGTRRRSTQLLGRFLNLFAVWPGVAQPQISLISLKSFRVFRRPSASVYYCQRKPKNRKNGVGLGTRL